MLLALAGVAQWIEHGLQTKGLPVQFPVRAHAWVAGQVPSRGHVKGNHTLMFLSLSFSLPSTLSKNNKSLKKPPIISYGIYKYEKLKYNSSVKA